MSSHRMARLFPLLVVLTIVLGGCFSPPIVAPIQLPTGNLIRNPSADEGTAHWTFYTADASVQDSSGSPSFASKNGVHIWQTIDTSGAPPGYAVLMGISASQTVGTTGMGTIYGIFRDITGFELGQLRSDAMYARSQSPSEWEILADRFPIPASTATITVFLDQTALPGVPMDGTYTWFDDIELHLVETLQETQDLIDGYTADHTW